MARSWGHQVFLAVDQTANAILGGYADETLSARSYRMGSKARTRGEWDQWRVAWIVVDALFVWQDMLIQWRTGRAPEHGHCERAYIAEQTRMHLPPEYRP